MNVKIEKFTKDDKGKIFKLLLEAELPTEDLSAEKLQYFLVARRQDDTVIGSIGLEIMQDVGLLRSLVVHPDHRKTGLGKLLTYKLELLAQDVGVKALYLLTTTATDFFLSLNYHITSRDTVPMNIAETDEFKSICPSSSVCLYKKFNFT